MSTADDRKRRLSRAAVLDAAMGLLDAEGFDALTMRNLAERLDVVPMAIYRHVRNKDDLIDGVLDRAVAEVELPPAGVAWREALHGLADAIRTTMLRHPAVVAAVVNRPSLGPSSLLLGEYGFAALRQAGFDDDRCEPALNLVLTYTLGFVALEVPRTVGPAGRPASADLTDPSSAAAPGRARSAGRPTAPLADDGPVLASLTPDYDLLPAEAFPHTRHLRPAPGALVSPAQFTFGLDRILDGLALLLPGAPGAPAPAPPTDRPRRPRPRSGS